MHFVSRRKFLGKGFRASVALGWAGAFWGSGQRSRLHAEEAKRPETNGKQSVSETGAGGEGWELLFDGKTLGAWKRSDFGAGGEVRVEDGVIMIEAGEELSGIQFQGEPPRMNYEIELQARRMQGIDFFCTVTFPVGERYVSFVVGGWGGATVGISSINHADASRNETTSYRGFEDKVWYRIRVRVEPGHLGAWIDDTQVVNLNTQGKDLDLRPGEIEISKPLGIATFRTEGQFRGLRLRRLKEERH